MLGRPPLLVLLALLAAACTPFGTGASTATALVGETVVSVEVADSAEERARGLMGRETLPRESGMVFLFPGRTDSGFFMKDTLVPLSIAFLDEDGRILRILDMDPCRRDPCRIYAPGVTYTSALEVNQRAFRRWGVEAGDRIELRLPEG